MKGALKLRPVFHHREDRIRRASSIVHPVRGCRSVA